ncbi:hypothetical protein PPTG_21104 [Phytophthora nicotianae INRA-310]|uniref:Uncharacterized protein n=1 Tax=Phytophthora nicotianae (strain INRA-310) TaxID=761204 RepID=W2RAL4_PHYN3|nr:hypothetical protein PPTG_21104 [Phytophthora nicotianae INRA-310]ETN21590.1 hypothetical protein PPTG_21104 [Phytophthora nicotianae INRA-310]
MMNISVRGNRKLYLIYSLGFEIDVKLRKMYGKILAQILCTGTLPASWSIPEMMSPITG